MIRSDFFPLDADQTDRLEQILLNDAGDFDLKKQTIALAFRGSVAHGTFIPNTSLHGIDDIDVLGAFVPPLSYTLGLKTCEQFAVFENEWDVLIYDIRKLIRLLKKANPNVMQLLWTPDEMFLIKHPVFDLLRENRHLFATKTIYASFCGYSFGQLKKMRATTYQGYMGQKRKMLVDKYGYDCKNAQHLIRLLRQAIEFMSSGELNVVRPDAEELIAIKSGRWSLEKIENESARLFEELATASKNSSLPERSDDKSIDELTQECLIQAYRLNALPDSELVRTLR